MAEAPKLSPQLQHLCAESKKRYTDKLTQLGIDDPYLFPQGIFTDVLKCESSSVPEFEYHDLYNYVVFNPSPYTGKDLKAYKSLDAYKYFVAGWVTNLQQWAVPGKDVYLIQAKVKHSQRLSDPTLQPWVAIQKDGQVMFGHCTCMAGLGEVCSHIAATMFAMESAVRHLKSRTCTDGPRQWGQTVVSGGKAIFARGSAIDFTNPERKRQLASCGKGPAPTKSARQQVSVCKTVDDEVGKQLYEDLSKSGVKSAILSIIPGYCENYVPKSILLNLPPPLTELYRPEYLDLPYQDLLKKCEEAFHQLAIDDEQAAYIEAETRKQSKSKLWFHMRAGRVTASRFKAGVFLTSFKAAARTDPANPSLSLIKQICYPEAYKFTSAATDNLFPVNLNTTQMSGSEVFLHEDRWGCKHESVARKIYGDQAKASHACFQLEDAGLQIHPEHPYLGASPDGLVSCQCCGRGVLEIKCPYCKRHLSPEQATNEPGFCLENVGGRLRLKRDHTYYYQVQAQLHLTANRSYCDFVVWTKDSELFVERISKDSNCFLKALENITLFFKVGVLPELMGKWFTRPVHSNTTEPVAGASTLKRNSCFCQQPENGIMVKCQSLCCNVERFHLQCLGLKNPPKNKNWLCPNCRKIKSVLKNCSTNS